MNGAFLLTSLPSMMTAIDCPPTKWQTLAVNSAGMVSFSSGIVSNGRLSTASDSSVGWLIVQTHQLVGMPRPSGVFCFSFDPEGVKVIVGL